MRNLLLISFITIMAQLACAQGIKITDKASIATLRSELAQAYSEIETMQCQYQQEKTIALLEDNIKTQGVVIYHNPRKLYWSMKDDYDHYFAMCDDNIKIVNANGETTMPINNHPIFREIAKMVIAGEKRGDLIDDNNFYSELYEYKDTFVVQMKPKKNRMKAMFGIMTLIFDKETKIMKCIEMTETSGDKTTITLHEVVINQKCDNSMFTF